MATQTLTITNFSGRLTRLRNGDINSGLAKFDTSWGYDPFSKPGNLTWLDGPKSVAGVSSLIVGGINKPKTPTATDATSNTFLLGIKDANTGMLFKIAIGNTGQGANDASLIGQQSVQGNYSWAGDLAFFGVGERLYFSGSEVIGVAASAVGGGDYILNGFSSVISTASNLTGHFHPLEEFAGKLAFGNGPTIGAVDTTGTIISSIFTISALEGPKYSELFPPLPSDQVVHDLDVAQDNNYLLISASSNINEDIGTISVDLSSVAPGQGKIYGWNGVDKGVTTALTIPGGTSTALQTYLGQHLLFLNDILGSAVSDGTVKRLTLQRNKSPFPNATDVTGNFLTWACPEVTIVPGTATLLTRVASLYYFGSLDEENPVGLYRLTRLTSPLDTGADTGLIYQVPYHAVVANGYTIFSVAAGTHLFSTYSISTSASVLSASTLGAANLYSFEIPAPDAQSDFDQPQAAVYETQTQLFSKRVSVSQVRVYCDPTFGGNAFRLEIIGANGVAVENGAFDYAFPDIVDPQSGSTSVERINFQGNVKTQFSLGIRITNTGTSNMTIKKIEIDYTEEGK